MPRPSRYLSVLRTTRQILGLSQPALAQLVGCSAETITKFENGKTGISKALAHRISAETRLDQDQLLTNSEPDEPRLNNGVPLTKEEWQKARTIWNNPTLEQVDQELNEEMLSLALLHDAGVLGNKYRLVATAVRQQIEQLLESFGLAPRRAELRREYGLPENPDDDWQITTNPRLLKEVLRRRQAFYAEREKAQRPTRSPAVARPRKAAPGKSQSKRVRQLR